MIPKKYSKIDVDRLEISAPFSTRSINYVINLGGDSRVNLNINSLNKIRLISKLDPIRSYREYFLNFSNALNIGDDDSVRWDIILDMSRNREYMNYLKGSIDSTLGLVTSYHLDIIHRRIKTYTNLTPVELDGEVTGIPSYFHASITGRTSIKCGTNFLTMPKGDRGRLRSLKPDHVLIAVDFKSCEPSFYLKSIGRSIDHDDVYEDVALKLDIKMGDRSRFKRGILSILYGAGDSTSKKLLKCSSGDLVKIKEYFNISEFKNALEEQFERDGVIFNYYGRPICSNASLINYWIQSSAVDYCSLTFDKFISDTRVNPCFFVHDCLVFEMHESRISELDEVHSLIDPHTNISIPVEFSVLGR